MVKMFRMVKLRVVKLTVVKLFRVVKLRVVKLVKVGKLVRVDYLVLKMTS